MSGEHVTFTYTNHRGETSTRTVLPLFIFFGKSQWHEGEQWLLEAYDEGRAAVRTFAVAAIQNWKPCG